MIGLALTALVAAIHAYIVVLEMFLWTGPRGRKVFGLTQDFANATKALAANQGLYNGFLVAGLVWGLCSYQAAMFFLCCVIVAGIFGSATVSRRILLVQSVPAALALLARVAGV